jgi:hypothetical protein
MKLRTLSADDIQAEWDWLRNGLLHCAQKTGAKYRPEDVYLRLRTNTAWAYAFGEDAFLVLTQEYDPDGLVLFVWALWAAPGSLRGSEGDMYAELERIARETGAKRIRMQSPREGWQRETFFQQVAIVYEHEVTT